MKNKTQEVTFESYLKKVSNQKLEKRKSDKYSYNEVNFDNIGKSIKGFFRKKGKNQLLTSLAVIKGMYDSMIKQFDDLVDSIRKHFKEGKKALGKIFSDFWEKFKQKYLKMISENSFYKQIKPIIDKLFTKPKQETNFSSFEYSGAEDYLFLNESFSLPFSKDSSPGNVIKITYKLDDQHKINVNSITGVAEIIGTNSIEMWKKIGFTSTNGTYKWKKNEWKIIKNFIENSKSNNNVNNKDNQSDNNETDSSETNDNEIDNSKNNDNQTDNSKANDDEVNNTKANDDETVDSKNNNDETDNAKDSNNEINNGKTSDFFSKMIKGINSDTFKYLIIGLIICTAIGGTILTGGLSAGFSGGAGLASQGVEAINSTFSLAFTTEQVAKWLGYSYIGASIGSALFIDKYVKNMSKSDVEKSMETANKSGFLSFITNLIKKIMQKIGLKKKEEPQKEINDWFINKKIYDKKIYNEEYLMSEYFKIENKLRKKPVF